MEEEEKAGGDHHQSREHLLKAVAQVCDHDRANEVDNENNGERSNEGAEKDGKTANELGVDRQPCRKGRDWGSARGEKLLKFEHFFVTEDVVLHTPDYEATDEDAKKNDAVFAASMKPVEMAYL